MHHGLIMMKLTEKEQSKCWQSSSANRHQVSRFSISVAIISQFILLFKLNKIILTALTFPWWCCQQGRQWGWPPSAMYLCPARGASHTWAKKLLGIVFWTCQLVILFVFDIKALSSVQFWVRISDPRTNWALFHQIRIAKLEAYKEKGFERIFLDKGQNIWQRLTQQQKCLRW